MPDKKDTVKKGKYGTLKVGGRGDGKGPGKGINFETGDVTRGRKVIPIKFSKAQIRLVEKLAAVLTVDQICNYMGIPARTFYSVMEKQPEIKEALDRGRATSIYEVGKSLKQKALEGHPDCMKFYLKCLGGWRETQQVDVTNSDGSMAPRVIKRVIIEAKPEQGEVED